MSTRTKTKAVGAVAVVGLGPGPAELLTLRAGTLIEAAGAVVSDGPPPAAVAERLRPDTDVVDVAGRTPAEVARTVVSCARGGRAVVRVVAGDPLLDGTAGTELEALARSKLGFEIVPGVSSLLAAPTYAGIPLRAGKLPPELTLVLAADEPAPDWPTVAAARTAVVRASAAEVGKVAARLVEAGRPGDTPVAVTWGAASADQETLVSTLDAVETDVAAAAAASRTDPAVMVVGDAVRLRERLSWFETRPLFGWRVLLPRTREQAGSLADQLVGYGAVPVEVPTIAVEPPRTPAPMDRAVRGLVSGRYQWVAFTSTNAVRAVRERFEEVGLDARAFAGVKVAAVGEATAAALRAFGIRPELVPSGEQSSDGLLADWPHYDDQLDPLDRVFLPRADIATETLVAGLKDRGWAVDDVTAYRTVRAAPPPAETRDAIKSGGFDAVLFTSSSTVRNLVGIAGKPHSSTVIAVIGPQTARTATELGLRVDVVAGTPAVAALVEALADFARQRREAGQPGRPSARAARRATAKPPTGSAVPAAGPAGTAPGTAAAEPAPGGGSSRRAR